MVVISKQLFDSKVSKDVSCGDLHFWTDSCWKASVFSPYVISRVARGTAKFYLPIYLLKLMVNYKKINDINFIKSLVIEEGISILYGISIATSLIGTVCLLRKIFGRFYYCNLLLVPGLVSSLSILIETKQNQVLDTLIFFNSLVETILNVIDKSLFNITKTRETLMFMAVSALLMYILENRRRKNDMLYFWFYTPPLRKDNIENEGKSNICEHAATCLQYWKEGFLKYFPLGYLINVIRRLIPKMGTVTKHPLRLVPVLFSTSNVKFGLFLGSYVAIYRILICNLLKFGKVKRKFHGLIAGLLSGLTYAISPNIQVLIIGITTILQMCYSSLSHKFNIKNHFWPRQLVYTVSHSILLHMSMCYPDLCASYYKNMLRNCTNNMIGDIRDNIVTLHFPEELAKEQALRAFL